MYILGINPSHNATAAIMKDGKVVACVSEERFNRKKNYWGFPTKSLQFCLEQLNISASDVNLVVISSTIFPASPELGYSKSNLAQLPYNFMKISQRLWREYIEWYLPFLKIFEQTSYKFLVKVMEPILQRQIRRILNELGFENKKIIFADHHTCHAYTAFYGAPFLEKGIKDVLVVTCDGEGDLVSATVGVFKRGKYQILSKTDQYNSIGTFYSEVTQFLGMKALEHEYKVMGLAPYASEKYAEKLYEKVKDWIRVNKEKLEIETIVSSYNFRKLFNKYLRDYRFDIVAALAQMLCERKVLELVEEAIKNTGVRNVVVSGGVFMNVKMNKLISESKEVRKFFVFPSCGDESNAFGACYFGFMKLTKKELPKPIRDLYLGPEFNEREIREALMKYKDLKVYKPKNLDIKVAELLKKGEVVARFAGRSEWGARSLGNRTLLADPANFLVVEKINRMIKSRDFWMPFAPVIMDEQKDRYLNLYKKQDCGQYMIMAYDTKEDSREDIIAAIHPYDKTARPQILSKDWNEDLWRILNEFRKLTGRGALLNTSFNIHGEPIVGSPDDALSTLKRSGLKYLVLGDHMVEKGN